MCVPEWVMMADGNCGRFVYQVVVPKAFAPRDLVKVYEGDERVVLPAWDPMVSVCSCILERGRWLTE